LKQGNSSKEAAVGGKLILNYMLSEGQGVLTGS